MEQQREDISQQLLLTEIQVSKLLARSARVRRITRCGTKRCLSISYPACSQYIVFVVGRGKTQNGFPFAFLLLARSLFPHCSLSVPCFYPDRYGRAKVSEQ